MHRVYDALSCWPKPVPFCEVCNISEEAWQKRKAEHADYWNTRWGLTDAEPKPIVEGKLICRVEAKGDTIYFISNHLGKSMKHTLGSVKTVESAIAEYAEANVLCMRGDPSELYSYNRPTIDYELFKAFQLSKRDLNLLVEQCRTLNLQDIDSLLSNKGLCLLN